MTALTSDSGRSAVDPSAFRANAQKIDVGVQTLQAQLDALRTNENRIGNPLEMDATERARSDFRLMKTRELQATLEEIKKAKAQGARYASELEDQGGFQTGTSQSSYRVAYDGLKETNETLAQLQRKAASQLTELNDSTYKPIEAVKLDQDGVPIDQNGSLDTQVANQKALVRRQVDQLAERRARIQQQIRSVRDDESIPRDQRLASLESYERSLTRTQDEILKRQKMLGGFPYYYPSDP